MGWLVLHCFEDACFVGINIGHICKHVPFWNYITVLHDINAANEYIVTTNYNKHGYSIRHVILYRSCENTSSGDFKTAYKNLTFAGQAHFYD